MASLTKGKKGKIWAQRKVENSMINTPESADLSAVSGSSISWNTALALKESQFSQLEVQGCKKHLQENVGKFHNVVKNNNFSLIKSLSYFEKRSQMFWQSRRYNTLGSSSRIQFQNSGAAGLGFYQDPSYKAPVNLLWAYTAPNETHTESPGTRQDHLALFITSKEEGGKNPTK